MTRTPARVLSVVLAALLGACEHADECRYDEFSCDADVARNCVHVEASNGSYYAWQSTPCDAGKCKLETYQSLGFPPHSTAFCALATEPDSRCAGLGSTFCDGTLLTHCRGGYAAWTDNCAAADSERKFCVTPTAELNVKDPSPAAMCATEPEPSPLCEPFLGGSSSRTTCDGNDSIQCNSGYVSRRSSCGDRFCRGDGICALSGDPDPGCLPNENWMNFCEGNAVVLCNASYRLSVQACPGGAKCSVNPASCNADGQACTLVSCAP